MCVCVSDPSSSVLELGVERLTDSSASQSEAISSSAALTFDLEQDSEVVDSEEHLNPPDRTTQ